MSVWHYASNNQPQGPVPLSEFRHLINNGTITPDTLVWRQGMPQWQALRIVLQNDTSILPPPEPTPPPIPFSFSTTTATPPFANIVAAGTSTLRYAGFFIRVAARLIDFFILWITNQIVLTLLNKTKILIAPPLFIDNAASPQQRLADILTYLSQNIHYTLLSYLIVLAIAIAYEVFFVRKYSATPGKLALGLRLVRSDGSRLSSLRIIGRHFADLLNQFAFGIPYFIIAIDEQKRGVHDLVCDTRVIHKPTDEQ